MLTRYRATGVTRLCSSRPMTLALRFAAPFGYDEFANLSEDRTCDADDTTVGEVADILGTLVEDLKTLGLVSA